MGSYQQKTNRDNWENPSEVESLGDDTKQYRSKGLTPKLHQEEKKFFERDKGIAFATWNNNIPVKYITDTDERASYELKLDKGKNLFFWRGQPIDTTTMHREISFQPGDQEANKRVIFVMTVSGSIYVADEGEETRLSVGENNEQQWRFNHSTLVAGEAVASAGELWFENGILMGISDKSGHYRPELAHTIQVLKHFQSLGVDISGIIVERLMPDNNGNMRPVQFSARQVLLAGESELKTLSLTAKNEINDLSSMAENLKKHPLDNKQVTRYSLIIKFDKARSYDPNIITPKHVKTVFEIALDEANDILAKYLADNDSAAVTRALDTVSYVLEVLHRYHPSIVSSDLQGTADSIYRGIKSSETGTDNDNSNIANPELITREVTNLMTLMTTAMTGYLDSQGSDDMRQQIDKVFSRYEKKDDIESVAKSFVKTHEINPDLFKKRLEEALRDRNWSLPDFVDKILIEGAEDWETFDEYDKAIDVYNLANWLDPREYFDEEIEKLKKKARGEPEEQIAPESNSPSSVGYS